MVHHFLIALVPAWCYYQPATHWVKLLFAGLAVRFWETKNFYTSFHWWTFVEAWITLLVVPKGFEWPELVFMAGLLLNMVLASPITNTICHLFRLPRLFSVDRFVFFAGHGGMPGLLDGFETDVGFLHSARCYTWTVLSHGELQLGNFSDQREFESKVVFLFADKAGTETLKHFPSH